MNKNYLSAEVFTEGNSSRVCDLIADALLDQMLMQDPDTIADIKVILNKEAVLITGHVTTSAKIDYPQTVRNVARDVGYTDSEAGFDVYQTEVRTEIFRQSQDIARGIITNEGAGDTMTIYGYAANETLSYMPFPITMARLIADRIDSVRKSGIVGSLRPDGKVQVVVEYLGDEITKIDSVVIQVQHSPDIDKDWLQVELEDKVVKPVCKEWIDTDTKVLVNTAGRFVLGGPVSDIGVNGENIIAQTYGGASRWGSAKFSGKDASKIDRTGSLIARKAAKLVIANNYAQKCEVAIIYAMGMTEPLSVEVDTFGTGLVDDFKIISFIKENLSLRPTDVIKEFKLKTPLYLDLSKNGHFGRDGLSWESV